MKQFDFNLFFDYEILDVKLKNLFKGNEECLQSIEDFKKGGFKQEGLYFMERYIDTASVVISDYERYGVKNY